MNAYMIFNGVSSRELDLIVEKLPDEPKPRRNTEEVQILGKPGRAIMDLGSYDLYQTSAKLNCNGRSPSDVYAWLSGEGWLTTSEDPQYMRWVCFYDQINDTRFRVDACYDTLTAPMRVQPYKYLAVQEPMTLMGAKVFPGQGNDIAAPLIEISGTGDVELSVNRATVLISNLSGAIYLDCDAKIAYTESDGAKVFAGRQVAMVDEWPYLEPGENSVNWSGEISYVKITPWWRWI